jgi:hypothetical protein
MIEEAKSNNIGMLIPTEVEENSLLGVISYYHVLAIPYKPTNELVSPDSFRFSLR